MGFFASINGMLAPAEEARVSVLDNGFTFGDSVYETLRTYAGRPFALARHLRRLRASAGRIGIEMTTGDDVLAGWLDALLARAANPEAYIRMIVTRGVGDISYHFERVKGPTVVMVTRPHELPAASQYTEGIPVSIVSVLRNHPDALDPAIKSGNLLNNVLAVREAQAKGSVEAILLNHRGEVAEGASSNIFIVRGQEVITPPLDAGILAGITREIILELLPGLGIGARQKAISVSDLERADEAFITSSLKEAAPISTLNGRPVGSGRPGPVTLRILEAFRAYAQEGRT